MISSRPYLLRAIYDWILDNHLSPYILVDAEAPYLQVPPGHAIDEKIILNVSPLAVTGLVINNEALEFKARFGGRMQHVYVPMEAVIAIYAFENGRGLMFEPQEDTIGDLNPDHLEDQTHAGHSDRPPPKPPKKGPPKLTIVK